MIFLRERTIQEPASIICDRCGRRAEVESEDFEFAEYLSLDRIGGYGSIIGDGTRLQLDLCEYCIKELLYPFARISEP
jgi:hypothetical protein